MLSLPMLLPALGCSTKAPPPVPRYQALGPKDVPEILRGTILERADLMNAEPFPVSGYGLVANLDGTGGGQAPARVRQYMIGQMAKNRFGSETLPEMKDVSPDSVLRNPRFAVVEVRGLLPPGIRKGQFFDAQVFCLPDNQATSLAGGDLYQTDLRIRGADPIDPGGAVNTYARAQGPIFVNPAYAFERRPTDPQALRSLRQGIVLDGTVAMVDRPLGLRLRQPQFSAARRTEFLIDERFQELSPDVVAAAQDEAIVHFYVPRGGPYARDWAHYAGVVTHMYLDSSRAFKARKARELAEEAVKPGALLEDIALCWEGLGAEALPVVRELTAHSQTDVAFAATRAAAFLGDADAPPALAKMAADPNNPFRISAVQTLGSLPSSPPINQVLRPLLNAAETTIRIEAYRVLARNNDPAVITAVVKDSRGGETFFLDVVPSRGAPLVFATRTGLPRVAIIGDRARLTTPLLFTAMEQRLSLSAADADKPVTIYYRGPNVANPVTINSSHDLAEVVARLAGEGSFRGTGLDFSYSHIVAILNALTEQHKVLASVNGQGVPAAFMLEDLPAVQAEILSPPSQGTGRPQADADLNPPPPPPAASEDGMGMAE